jgi:hypothetical protein
MIILTDKNLIMATTPQKLFMKNMYKKTSYRANWMPDKPLQIGDIGKLEDGTFTLFTTLEKQGIVFTTRERDSGLDLDYSSKDTVKISENTGAEIPIAKPVANIKAKLNIELKSEDSILYQTTGSKIIIIDNLDTIETEMLQRYKDDKWMKNWVVITEIIKTDFVTIIISQSKNNTLEFEASGNAKLQSINLADASLGLNLVRESGSSIKMLAKQNLTPLYKVRGIWDPWIGATQVREKTRGEVLETMPPPTYDKLRDMPFNEDEFLE